ncbi:AAA family ATPase [candidate division KSB1 bacterium]|nr:AAA family ATPase [candidate division KSB1 bacterium]
MRTKRLGFFIRFLFPAIIARMLLTPTLLAQTFSERPLKFEHLTVAHGLSQSSVHCMLQDRRGFMWFGTGDGLNRFDGYNFVAYKNEAADSTSISSDWILSIYEDRAGTLWVGTFSGGLNRFDPATEQFTRFVHDPGNPHSLSENKVNTIHEDHTGALWIGTEHGLNQFDHVTNTFTRFLPDPQTPHSLGHPTVCALYEDRSRTIWIGTEGGGLHRLDPATKQFTRFVHDPNDAHSLSDNIVRAIYEDRAGRLWIGTGRGGLNQFDRSTQKFTRYAFDPNPDLSSFFQGQSGYELSHPEVRSICEDRFGTFWLGTLGGGLNRFDPATGRFTYYVENPNPASRTEGSAKQSLSNNRVFSVRSDRAGALWIGTDNGLNKLDPGRAPFTALVNELENSQNSSHNIIWAICKDRRGALWIGTENGFFRRTRDERGQEQAVYFSNFSKKHYENKVNVIYEDRRGMLWVGTDYVLKQFDPDELIRTSNGRFGVIRWEDDPQNPSMLSRMQIFSICEDSTGANTLWVGTSGGLVRLRRNDDGQYHRTAYKQDPNDPNGLGSNNLRPLFVDHSGVLWVGTWHDGLQQFDAASGRFKRFAHDQKNPHSLINNVIRSLHEDRAGRLWIGTDGGLDSFDRHTEQFQHYTEKDGLPNSAIWGILEDDHGRLWLSTNNGIACFTSTASAFKNYTVEDGLSHQEFNRGAWFKSRDGEMFFGGMNGVTAFHPDSIKDNPFIPPVVITAFKRYNTDDAEGVAIVEKGIFARREINLSYKDNIISFEFAALNFRNPEKNQYAYKLEGYREQWIQLGTNREATFTNLDPGGYVLHVKGSNNDGVWNEAGTSLKIIVTPPWWKTLWFRILSVVTLIGLVLSAHRLRIADIKARNKALEKEIIKRQQAEEALRQAFMEISQLKEQLQAENIYLQQEIKLEHNYDEIIGESEALKYVLHKVEQVASGDTTVLLLGETGVGKELFARAIHHLSPYRERPLVKLNCAALPSHLIESELFGHEKGAFTGAVEKQLGRFELADGTTIFLDEIGELPLELQPKLLRVLQDGEFERLGNPKTLKVKTRVIAATNRDLDEEIRQGRFRKDLFYRLSVYPITVPALRKRQQDIPLLVGAFVQRFSKKLGKSIDAIPQKTMQALQQYAWPGNVRELQNVIERAVVTTVDNTLRIELPALSNATATGAKTLEDIEREHILKTLEATQWKIEGAEGAAARLGLNPSTLRSRMNKLGIRRV